MLQEGLGVGRRHPRGPRVGIGVVVLLGLGVAARVLDGQGVPLRHSPPRIVVAVTLVVGARTIGEQVGEEVDVPVLALAAVVAGPGQDVGAVDRLDRVLDLDADDQDRVGHVGEDGVGGGAHRHPARAARPLHARTGFVQQALVDRREKTGEVSLVVETRRHEIADDALIDRLGIGNLVDRFATRLEDVVLDAGTRFLGMEFLAAGAEVDRVGRRATVDLLA